MTHGPSAAAVTARLFGRVVAALALATVAGCASASSPQSSPTTGPETTKPALTTPALTTPAVTALASSDSTVPSAPSQLAPQQIWIRQIGGDGAEVLLGLANNDDGSLWVSGHTDGVVGASNLGGQDMLAVKFAADGTVGTIVQGGGIDADSLLGAAPAPDNGLYAVGYTKGQFEIPNVGVNDITIARYAADGAEIWRKQLGGPDWDRGFAVASFDGGLYVGGYTFGGLSLALGGPDGFGGHDAALARLSDTGEVQWVRQFGTDSVEWGQGLAVTPDGGVVITGYTQGAYGGEYLAGC